MLHSFLNAAIKEFEDIPEKLSIKTKLNLGLLVLIPIIGVITFYKYENWGKNAKLLIIIFVILLQLTFSIIEIILYNRYIHLFVL